MLRKALIATVLGGAMLAITPAARAAFIPTTASFFTTASAGTFTFTYLGHSANDTDTLDFLFNGQTVFVNSTSPVGTQVSINVGAAGTYKLSLVDTGVPATWYSDPAANSDGSAHLVSTTNFSDFDLGGVPNVPGNSAPYYGWEDRAFPGADADYNDLVFTETFTGTPIPEPVSMVLLGTGLVGLGVARYRRSKAS